ncbi:porin [Ignatzschineria sp. RMDPL8A]|uniref:porin n=1 Tax=Ignatzschineria sp. RMDPL8A TaxID=2999236 RepID=UPI002446731F|nr:porin [Ignatzschineria sp. RMDPL8A]MDG9728815.1 porin [Ignatzschineria sp. RMDPL8A]
MKKGLLAVAVAGALTMGAAQAETSIYGSIRYDYNNIKQEIDAPKGEAKRVSDMQDQGSRIGIKGSEDLGNGLALVFKLEFGFNGMEGLSTNNGDGFNNRIAMIGLAGDWGTFAVGRLDNPFKQTIVDGSVIDDFNSTWSNSSANAALRYAFADQNIDRVGNALAYISPEFSGFSANAAFIIDDTLNLGTKEKPNFVTKKEKHLDIWTINAQYQHELGFYGKVGYIQGKLGERDQENVEKSKAWGTQLGYKQDQFGLTVSYADSKNGNKKDKGWDLGGYFAFGNDYSSTIRANYGQNKPKVDGQGEKTKRWALGFQQDLSERTRVWVEYGETREKVAGETFKDNGLSIGIRHDF